MLIVIFAWLGGCGLFLALCGLIYAAEQLLARRHDDPDVLDRIWGEQIDHPGYFGRPR